MLKYSQTPGIFKLEGSRLGRPYHRLPNMFTGKFDTLESHLGNYFLKKHRTNITLKKISCEMDLVNKTADLLISQVGHLAFDIDRAMLLMLLSNFYGLDSAFNEQNATSLPPTKTETRLKNRLALDICNIIFHKNTTGIPLSLKHDNGTVKTHWPYQITFTFGDSANNCFRVLLDDAHTDLILNMLRRHEHHQSCELPDPAAVKQQKKALIDAVINSLPLTLSVKLAELSLSVADLTRIGPGDILPIMLPEAFPVYIGKSELFNAFIVEDKDKLFLAEITGTMSEKYYE